MAEPIRVFERYEILRKLTSGGMGDIFLAQQRGAAGFERLVILKSLRPDLLSDEEMFTQFLAEARTIARLNHPNVVAVLEVNEYRGVYFIAMEYIEGADLSALRRAASLAQQRIPFRVSAGIVHGAALGLGHAHEAKDNDGASCAIVHRDVSPQNIMVRSDGITKVLDFGIAIIGSSSGALQKRVQGKLRYMSPEQALGHDLKPATDQFSLGVVLWELCTQRLLFNTKSPRAILRDVVRCEIPAPSSIAPDVPKALEQIVMRSLAKEQSERYSSLREMAEALRTFLDTTGGSADRHIEACVRALVGAEISARTNQLKSEPVTIPGLLETTEIPCHSCGRENQLRDRYCSQCGAPLIEQTPPQAAQVEEPERGLSPSKRTSIHGLLLEHGSQLVGRLGISNEQPVIVLATLITGRAKLGHAVLKQLDQRLLKAMSSTVDSFEGRVVRLTAEELVVLFVTTEHATQDTLRALRCALELQSEVSLIIRTTQQTLGICQGVSRGHARLQTGTTAKGPPIERARQIAQAAQNQNLEGVFVDSGVTTVLDGAARFEPHAQVGASRLEHLLGKRSTGFDEQDSLPMVGRRTLLFEILGALNRARAGSGESLLLIGEPGCGKTRLLDEVTSIAQKRGFLVARVHLARGEAETAPDLLLSVWEAVKELVHEEEHLTEIGLHPSIVAAALTIEGSGKSASKTQQRIWRQALFDLILGLCERQPTVIVADDLGHADPQAIATLKRFRELAPSARLVVISASSEMPSPAQEKSSAPTSEWTQVQQLRALSDAELITIAQAIGGGLALPPFAAQVIVEHAEGNPGAARLIVESMIASGALTKMGPKWIASDSIRSAPLGGRFHEVLAARILGVAPQIRAFLKIAAVRGLAFDPRVITAVMSRIDADEVIAGAARSGFLRPFYADHQKMTFRQPTYRNALLAELSEREHKVINERLGRIMMASKDVDVIAVATHLLAGEALFDTVIYALRASAALGRTEVSANFARRAFALFERQTKEAAPHARAEINLVLQPALREYGPDAMRSIAAANIEESETVHSRISSWLDPSTEAALLDVRANLRLTQGRIAEALEDTERALAHLSNAPAWTRAQGLATHARALETKGDLSGAINAVMESLQASEHDPPDPDFLWQQSNALGRHHSKLGDLERADELFDMAHQQAEAAGRPSGCAAALTNRAYVCGERGETKEAIELLSRAEHFAQTAGDPIGVARALYNRGRLFAQSGAIEEAKGALRQSLRLALEVRWVEGQASAQRALDALGR